MWKPGWMTSCWLWFQRKGGRVKEARLNLWWRSVAGVAVVLLPEQKSATKARFDLVAVDFCTSALVCEAQLAGIALLSLYQAP